MSEYGVVVIAIFGIAILGLIIFLFNRPNGSTSDETENSDYYNILLEKLNNDLYEAERLVDIELDADMSIDRKEAAKRAVHNLDKKNKIPPRLPGL